MMKRLHQTTVEMTRKLGHKRNQGLALGNLGGLFVELKRFEEAEPHLLQHWALSAHISCSVGVYCGTLAWMYAQQANMTQVFHYLKKGEETIKVIPIEYGQFLCKKAKVLQLANQPMAASEALKEARAIGIG